MPGIEAYSTTQSAFGGWTRIDMLLAIYERAVESLENAALAEKEGNQEEYYTQLLKGQKKPLDYY